MNPNPDDDFVLFFFPSHFFFFFFWLSMVNYSIRSSKAAGLAEAALMEVDEVEVEEPKKRTGEKSSIMKGKCIPRKKSSSSNNNNKQQIKK